MTRSLQEEIKQNKPFANPGVEALVSILRTATVLEHEQNEALRAFGLTLTQYNVLRILQGAGPAGLCGRDIAERLISKVPDVSRLLDRMEDVKLVSRERDAADRRQVSARITGQGRRLVAQAGPAVESATRARFDRLGTRALASLVAALAAVRDPV